MIRFRLFGIPFAIAPYFWLGSALLGSNVAHGERAFPLLATWIGCVLVSVIIHEMGHALASRCFGVVPQVLLYGMGGLTIMQGPPLGRWQGILVTLAGPAAGIALFGATLAIGLHSVFSERSLVFAALNYLLYINLYWTLLNLLPVLPLDGGQVMRNLLGPARLGLTRIISGAVGVAACGYFLWQGQIYPAVFLGLMAFSNFSRSSAAGAPQ